jgi:glycosyltransferase involved in cell wall biosynthesis
VVAEDGATGAGQTGALAQPGPSARNRDTWAIVRCFNEASVAGAVVRELVESFPNVVGVDDGSSDGSAQVLREAGARVVHHEVNLGAGAALQTGIRFGLLDRRARYFVCFDADGQHRVSDAVAMVERLRREEVDVLIGSRFLGSSAGMPAARRAVLRAGRLFERLSSGMALTDAHNGLRAFTRRFATQVDLQSSDMAYASELLRAIRSSGLPYAEHPVTISYTRYSLAKGQRSVNSINIAVDLWVQRIFGRRSA